ncbi:MAG: restriction endonuclease [Verrucomicrobia bacterium]|nr:restriction endonuclease [Verrucomicrobiota bacterium]
MAIPDYQTCMLPLLKHYGDGREHTNRESIDALAKDFKLTDEERRMMLPSGVQGLFDNRVNWARTYMKKAALIESPRRGVHKITKRGADVLKKKPERIDVAYLGQFQEFNDFRALRHAKEEAEEPELDLNNKTPEESLECAYQKLRGDLAAELLQRLKACSPTFFERLVVEVIVKMGYGGTRQDAGKAIGKAGDGGIDGIIKEDKLGLDAIYIQAKRWENTVGRPEIQKFIGALAQQRAKKGLFITTSSFSSDAEDCVSRIEAKVVLIDGETLAQMMIDHNVGVSTVGTYEVKKIDSDYFSEE